MAPHSSLSKPGHNISSLKPFHQTHLGKLASELREKIFIELLATPPSFAGHDFATTSSKPADSDTVSPSFVDIQASWYQVSGTCRQIYLESRPIFATSKSLYLAGSPEMTRFFYFFRPTWRPSSRLDVITSLCLKDFVITKPIYMKSPTHDILESDGLQWVSHTDQAVKVGENKSIDHRLSLALKQLKNLRTVALCFRAGEELQSLELLHGLHGMRKCIVKFSDVTHWLFGPQSPEDPWSIQYAVFGNGSWGQGKDIEIDSSDRYCIERVAIAYNSKGLGLKNGDERYVEVQIQRPVTSKSLDSNGGHVDLTTASDYEDIDLLSQDSYEAQLENSRDEADNSALAGTFNHEDLSTETQPNPSGINQYLSLGLSSENNCDSQIASNKDQEEELGSLQRSSEDFSDIQQGTPSDHEMEGTSPSTHFPPAMHKTPAASGGNLFGTSDEYGQVDDETENSDHDFQHVYDSTTETENESDLMEDILGDKFQGHPPHSAINSNSPSRTKTTRSEKRALRDFLDTPETYKEEELGASKERQQSSIFGYLEQKQKQKERKQGNYHGK